MNISEIRENYPQYDHISDAELSTKMYDKFYAGKISKDDFNKKIGFTETKQKTEKKPSVLGSLWKDVKDVPGDIYGYGKQLVKEAPAFGGQLAHDPMRVFLKGGATIGQTAQDLANLPYHLARQLSPNVGKYVPHVAEKDIGKQLGVGDSQEGDAITQALATFAMPGIGEAKGLTVAEKVAQRALEGSVYAASQDPSKAVKGALTAVAAPLPIEGAQAAAKDIAGLTSRAFRGTATPRELLEAIEVSKKLPVDIGSITKSPIVSKTYSNIIANIPGSGVAKKYSKVGEHLESAGEGLLSDLSDKSSGEIHGDTDSLVQSMLENANESARDLKNNLYNKVSSIAEGEGHELTLPRFNDALDENIKFIEESPLLQSDPKIRKLFKRMEDMRVKQPKDAEGGLTADISDKPDIKEQKPPSIAVANFVKNELHHEGEVSLSHQSTSDKNIGKQYKILSKAIGDDIRDSIRNTGSKHLQDAYETATRNYKENYSDFLDKKMWKYLKPGRDPDAIVHEIIQPSRTLDKSTNIRKINKLLEQSSLPHSNENILGYSFLKNAVNKEGELTPLALSKQLNLLGKNQFNALFPANSTRNKIKNFTKLKKISGDALNYMFNPNTGQRNLSKLIGGLQASIGAISGGAGITHSLTGAAVGVIAPGIAANIAARYLTNPKVRKNLVNRMLKKESGGKKTTENMLADALSHVYARQPANQGGQ